MKTKDIWVIIPGLNEEKYIGTVLKKVTKVTKNIIVVDDGSTDNFAKIAKKYTPHVLSHRVNLGKGAALKTGCVYAFNHLNAEAVIFMDSDDQHDPNQLKLFFKSFKEGFDVVFGARSFDSNMPLLRIIGNRLASVAVLVLFGAYIPDIPSGFKGLSKKIYKNILWDANGYNVEMEIAARVADKKINFDIVPIKTIYHDLDRGMSFLDVINIVTSLISLRFKIK